MKKIILPILFVLAQISVLGSNDILGKRITIKLQEKPIATILEIISETNGFYFSYDPVKIKSSKMASVHAQNKTVKEVLDKVFNGSTMYYQISNHIIIKPKPVKQVPKEKGKKITLYYYNINGYIRDEKSGLGLSAISVFEKNKLNHTLSEDFGFYELSYTSKRETDTIYFASPLIQDTSIVVYGTSQPYRNDISFQLKYNGKKLEPLKGVVVSADSIKLEPLTIKVDTLDRFKELLADQKNKIRNLKIGKKLETQGQKIANLNISDSFTRRSQISLFTPIGTNGTLSPHVSNRLSFNLIAGYNGGVEAAEFGGVVNIIKNDVKGGQFVGFGNYVGGHIKGGQFAGFSNHNLGNAQGVTAAGFYNYQSGTFKGASMAGFANWHQDSVTGAQLAGFSNKAKDVKGVQIAGFLNKARNVKGAQIGFINIADSIDGVSVGFINIVKRGLHQLEAGYAYSNDLNLCFRTGTERLYTILGVVNSPAENSIDPWLGFKYGLGTNIKLNKTFLFNIEAEAHQPTKRFRYNYLRLNNQLRVNLEIRPIKHVAIFGGTGLGVNVFNYNDPNISELRSKYGDQYRLDNGGNTHVSMSPTWQVGLRFF